MSSLFLSSNPPHCHARLSVLLQIIISEFEGVIQVDSLLSSLLLYLDGLLSEGRNLLQDVLTACDASEEAKFRVPESLERFYNLRAPSKLKDELGDIQEFMSLFPSIEGLETTYDFKQDQEPLGEDAVKDGTPSTLDSIAALNQTSSSQIQTQTPLQLSTQPSIEPLSQPTIQAPVPAPVPAPAPTHFASEESGEEDEEEDYFGEDLAHDDLDEEDDEESGDEESAGKSPIKKAGSRCCPLCNKVFSKDFKNIEAHVKQCELIASHGDVRDGRTCPKCHKKYKRCYLIGRHLDLCQGDIMENDQLWSQEDGNLFKCKRCFKTYKSRHHFASHLATCEKRKKSSCSACNKYFPTQEDLDRHPCPKFSGDHKFSCQLCEYSCYYGPQLTKHYTSKHGGKRDYCCETCGKMYADPSVLATHRRTHAEPAHKCHECGKAFHRRATLTRHMTMHFSLNLPCETCGKCFSNQLYLNRHRNSQHPPDGIIVTHPCPHCSSSYREKKFLKKHIRDKHSFDGDSPSHLSHGSLMTTTTVGLGKDPVSHQTTSDCKTIIGLPFMHTIHS